MSIGGSWRSKQPNATLPAGMKAIHATRRLDRRTTGVTRPPTGDSLFCTRPIGGSGARPGSSDLHVKGGTHLGTSKDAGLRISHHPPFESRQSLYLAALPLAGEACKAPMRGRDYE